MSENRGKFTIDAARTWLANEPDMQVEALSDRLYTVTDGHCRALFAVGDDQVVAFDTFGTPEVKERLVGRWTNEVFPQAR